MASNLQQLLRQLNPTGPDGFEGLVAKLLESLTGQHFRLALSGSQEGRDMSSRDAHANVVAAECKRYGKDSELDSRGLLGELVQASLAIPDLDIWVLVTSRNVPSQLYETLHAAAAQEGVEFLSISSEDGSPSSLEALCACSPGTILSHPGVQAAVKPEEVQAWLQAISEQPHLQQQIAALRAAFSSPVVGYENWRVEQNRWFINCLRSDREARANFGQPINVGDERVALVKRKSAWTAMSDWLGNWSDTHEVLAILGEEGDGKTWSVASWLDQNIKSASEFPAVVFLSSTDADTQDPATLLSRIISHRLERVTQEQSQKRLDRWMSKPSGETPLLLLVLDGINERRAPDWWRTILEKLAGDPWVGHIALVVTCRTAYWQSYFAPLRHLSVSPFTVPPYDDNELDMALVHHGLHRTDIQHNLLQLIRKPRYFDLMLKHRDRMAQSGDVTVARLIYEDWRDRFERKRNTSLTDIDFQNLIRELANAHQRKESLLTEQDVAALLPVFRDGQAILEELRTGGILQPDRGNYKVNERMLVYGLGLLLADQVEQAAAAGLDIREAIANWLEPHAEMDIKAAICEFAALHALGMTNYPRRTKVALLHAWIEKRNPGQGVESNLAAYFPVDPESYVALAEVVWSDIHDSPWAQEVLIRAFLRWYSTPHVSPTLHAAFERWLGFVHIHGSPIGRRTTEDAERSRLEISQRIGNDVQPGPFSFHDYSLTAIDDDGQLRLGRAALAVISHLPRNQFIHAIATGCVAEAVMGSPYKYDLFAWVIRTSPLTVWPEVRDEVDRLLSINTIVTQQAAHRLLWFEGSDEAYGLQTTISDDIFPLNPLLEHHKKDPCTSGFSWTEEDCVACLQRHDLPIEYVGRQISRYCVDPGFPVPEELRSQFASLVERLDVHSLRSGLWQTEADVNLEMYEPVLAAYAPDALANWVRSTTCQIRERQGVSRTQLSIHLKENYLIFTPEVKDVIQRAWDELISNAGTWDEAAEIAEMFLFKVALIGMSAENQLSSLLRRPERADDLIQYEESFLPITDWELIRSTIAQANTTKALTRILWFLSAFPSSVPHEILNTSIVPLLHHDDSYIRSLVLEIVYRASETAAIEIATQGQWAWSATNSELENHWGSLLLSKYGATIPFDELCRRVHPSYLGYAVMCRGNQPSEVRDLAECIHRVWLGLATTAPVLPADLPRINVDSTLSGEVEHVSRIRLLRGTLSHTITFVNSNSSWGGPKGDTSDLVKDSQIPFDQRQQALLQIIREAVEQQQAAGNFLFARGFLPKELEQVMEQYPNMVAEWVHAALANTPDAIRRVECTSPFYVSLCMALIDKDVDTGTILYWRLQEVGTRVRIIDQDSEIELLDFGLFNAIASDPVTNAWKRRLEECSSDQELLKVAMLCQYGTGKKWLWSYISERMNSPAPIDRARSVVLLGFFDGEEALEALKKLLQNQPDTWLRDLARTSKQRWERNAWAKHWFRRFLIEGDEVGAWAGFRLFLHCADRRFWLWRAGIEAEIGWNDHGMPRRPFMIHNLETIRKRIHDNEKDMADQFLGHKILEGEVWPWISFS